MVRFFPLSVMPVVAFAWFVVVKNVKLARSAIEQSVSERVRRSSHRLRDQPEAEFRNCAVIVMPLAMEDAPRSWHMT